MRGRAATILCGLVLAAHTAAQAQTAPAITAADLQRRLEVLAGDSMRDRRVGSEAHDRALRYVIAELTRAGVGPGVSGRTFEQPVPVRRRQFAEDASGFRISVLTPEGVEASPRSVSRLPPGLAFLPLTGAFGLDLPWRAAAPDQANAMSELVFGGQLGQPDAIDPSAAANKIVVFMPPLRPDGQPEYQLQQWADELRRYRNSAAILLATYDLMPRSVFRLLTEPQFTLDDGRRSSANLLPPVIAIPRGVAEELPSYRSAAIHFAFAEQPFAQPPRNVVAVIPGSDPALRSEFVVLTASLEREDASGAVALLEIAEALASRPVAPRRSVLLVWTTAEEPGLLGATHFVANAGVPPGSVVATFTLDRLAPGAVEDELERGTLALHSGGRPVDVLLSWIEATRDSAAPAVALRTTAPTSSVCEGEEGVLARLGAPALRLTRGGLPLRGHELTAVDWARYTAVVGLAAAIVVDVANRPERAMAAQADQRAVVGCTPR